MNVPSLKVMPKNSLAAGKAAWDDLVSGPRAVIVVSPLRVASTISQLLAATEVKVPARSLWVCQSISTKDEFADLVLDTNSIQPPPLIEQVVNSASPTLPTQDLSSPTTSNLAVGAIHFETNPQRSPVHPLQ
jgi:hypothetical protein